MSELAIFSQAADADLDAIWFYGAQTWGADQADSYFDQIFDIAEMLSEMPGIGRKLEWGAGDIRVYFHKSHVIIYRTSPGRMMVLRVLGARQDWMAVLGGDA